MLDGPAAWFRPNSEQQNVYCNTWNIMLGMSVSDDQYTERVMPEISELSERKEFRTNFA